MTRVLITGASGFVGANLTRRLLADGHEVHVLLRQSGPPWRLVDVFRDLRIWRDDLYNLDGLRLVLRQARPDQVFHAAVYGAYPTQTDLDEMIRTNILGTVNLLRASLENGVEAFVNTGSSSEYGFVDHAPTEDERPEPNSNYAVTKLSATQFCRRLAVGNATRVSTLRLYSVYGPFEEPTRLIPSLVSQGVAGRLPPLANPDTARDFVYVDDACDAYVKAASLPLPEQGAVFNVGTGVQTTLAEAVAVARRCLKVQEEPRWATLERRSWDTHTWVADSRRITTALGWRAHTSFEEGFARTVEWHLSNGPHSVWSTSS